MDQLRTFVQAGCLVLVAVSASFARPNYGRNCSSCHDQSAPIAGIPEVVNFAGLADPDESLTGAVDRGFLKTYVVKPGGTVDLTVLVDFGNLTDHSFAVELKRTEVPGVENNGSLVFTADSDWFVHVGDIEFDPNRPYYTVPMDEGIIFSQPTEFTFTMRVDSATPADFYDLEFAVAGQPDFFYGDEHFYLRVVPEPSAAVLILIALFVLPLARNARR